MRVNHLQKKGGEKPINKYQILYRKATNGRITTKKYADKHPDTTVKETMIRKKKKSHS